MLSMCAIMSYVLFVVISMLFLFHGIRDYKKFGTLEKIVIPCCYCNFIRNSYMY